MLEEKDKEAISAMLKEIEDKLTEIIGRHDAQRMIHIFDDYDLWERLFLKGKESVQKEIDDLTEKTYEKFKILEKEILYAKNREKQILKLLKKLKQLIDTFPHLGNETLSHYQLCKILEKVADWKQKLAVLKEEILEQTSRRHLDEERFTCSSR